MTKHAWIPLFLFPAATAIVACGGNVSTGGSAGSGASTSATSGATSTSSSGSSSSGATSSSSSGTTSTSSSSTSSSGASSSSTSSGSTGGCAGKIELVVGNGAPTPLAFECANAPYNPTGATTASGYFLRGGVAPGLSTTLNLDGCVSAAANAVGISLSVAQVTAAGSFSGTLTYEDANGEQWTNQGALDVDVTTIGAVGEPIVGTFNGDIIHPPTTLAQNVSGTFSVCRLADEDTP